MIKVIAAALIKNEEGKVLGIHLNKERPEGVWVPPGGKLENGESLRECVIREVKEELDVNIEFVGLAAVTEEEYPDGLWTFILFYCKIINGEPKIMEPGKILGFKWMEMEDLKGFEEYRFLK